MVPAVGEYVALGDLAPGDPLLADDGSSVSVAAVVAREATATVYNFEVADAHNYFVSAPDGGPMVNAHNICRADKPAGEVLRGILRREYPSEHLGRSLNDIKQMLRTARGPDKKVLQKAKKILEQSDRLLDKLKGW